MLLAWDYSFLDDGERANRRSRTVTMNRAMAEDVFRNEDLRRCSRPRRSIASPPKSPAPAPTSRARNADELYELIRAHGALAPAGLAERVNGDCRTDACFASACGPDR